MTKKTKLISGLVLSTIIATGLYAKSCDMKDENRMQKNQSHMKHFMQKGKSHHKMESKIFFTSLKQLNLTDAQKEKVKTIMIESKKKKNTINDAFSKNSFDKEKFIKLMSEKRDNMLKSKANMIEKIYEVLDKSQKEQFKTLIDLKAQKKGMNFDKNSHGRG